MWHLFVPIAIPVSLLKVIVDRSYLAPRVLLSARLGRATAVTALKGMWKVKLNRLLVKTLYVSLTCLDIDRQHFLVPFNRVSGRGVKKKRPHFGRPSLVRTFSM